MIITDSLGIGGDKRAIEFNNKGANTFLHVSETGLLKIPTWKKLGIDSIAKLNGFNKSINQTAYTARMCALSNAKDTLSGHWEMMGIKTKISFPTFTNNGFPLELIDKLKKAFDGKNILGNIAASGTEILTKYAQDELDGKGIIVYTSADSVLQICGHEKYTGLETLYNYAKKAREICNSNSEWKVGRVIARPYIGKNKKWTRTSNRHDYAINPPKKTILDNLKYNGVKVTGIGKINDIFCGNGISKTLKGKSDDENMDLTIDIACSNTMNEFIFVNLVQFDSDFGHRRDPDGYAENINRFDVKLAKLINALKNDDLLIISSDHGNDPTWIGTGHTREHVPVTIYAKSFQKKPKVLNIFKGFGTIGNIVAKNFDIPLVDTGEDRFDEIN